MNDKVTTGPRLCNKTDELIELNEHLGFYLKEAIKVSITCQLPAMKTPGQCVSTWTLMEKIKRKARPYELLNLKVIKNTLTFIRFEGDLDSKTVLNHVLSKFNKLEIKLSGFAETISVKMCKLKLGSTRHEWESFFRDNPQMNEMKPGFRPDTIHVENLPIKWFGGDVPKAHILLKTFEVFGEIRRFHVPLLDEIESDPFSSEATSSKGGGFKRFSFTESLNFDAFLMYRDYISFVKAMDALRGMKLVKKLDEVNRYLEYDIRVDFDKTRHLSDKAIKRRQLARKYGIKSSEELKTFKDEVKKERERYEERIKLLEGRKSQARRLLNYLFTKVEDEELRKKKEEDAKKETMKIKQRLLLEEQNLREKLIEKRKEVLRNKLKEIGGLRSVALPIASTRGTIKPSENSVFYKNHKQTCKHYKTKSVVVSSAKCERNKITHL